jgi:hypothetical protein
MRNEYFIRLFCRVGSTIKLIPIGWTLLIVRNENTYLKMWWTKRGKQGYSQEKSAIRNVIVYSKERDNLQYGTG